MGVIQTGIDEGVFFTPQRRRAAVEVLILGLLSTGLLALFLTCEPVDSMARPTGLEPVTPRSVVWCSIH